MLNDPKLQKLMRDIVHKRLPMIDLQRVQTDVAFDSEGKDAVRFRLVVTPETVDAITGAAAIGLLLEVREQLSAEGEPRSPLVEYATEAELAEEAAEAGEAEPGAES